MEVIRISGSAFERGYHHGKVFAHKAHNALRHWLTFGKLNVDDVEKKDSEISRKLEGIERNLLRFAPSLLEEVSGIAAGSGLSFREALLLNSVTEFGVVDQIVTCTNVILADSPHGTLHAFNHDHTPELGARLVVGEVVTLENGPWVARAAWAGTVWTIAGINSFGLTQGCSGIWQTDKNWDDGIPSHMLIRLPLEQCKDVDEAVALLEEFAPIAHGYNMAFADAKGNAAIVEKSPTRQSVRRLTGRSLFCANRFMSEGMLDLLNADKVQCLTNSQYRLRNLDRLTRDGEVSWDLNGLQSIMRYHSEQGSICAHGRAGDLEGLHTAHSFLMIPIDRRILATEGPPCQFPYLPLGAWLL